jgi:hypothetical protein
MSRSSRVLLGLSIAIHLVMLISWRTGWLNGLFFDATVTHGRRGWDFYALYQAGHNVLAGDSAYESDGGKIEVVIPGGTYTPFRYLPLSAYTVGVALNLVPPRWAYRLWVAFTEVVLLGCVALTWRVVADPDRRARVAAMWLCYTPYYLELYMGQFSLVQGALVYVTLLAVMRPMLARWLAPSWVASVLWKQNTALFSPTMARVGRWRTLFVLLALLLLTAGPYFALVPGSLAAFARNFRSEPPWFQLGNLGLRQLVFDATWSIGDALGVQVPAGAHLWAQRAVLVVALGIPLALTVLDPKPDVVTQLGLWMSAYFLAYHHVWEHHYVMLLPVLVALTVQKPSPWLWLLYGLLAAPTPYRLIDPQGQVAVLDAMRWTPIRPLWQDLVYHASKALPALLLYVTLVLRIARPVLASWREGGLTLWPFVAADAGR